MATTKFKGQPVKVIGEFIKVGSVAPDFELVKTDLSSFSLKELNGKNVILNIFPSLDTGVCATSVRKFNKLAAGLPDTVVLAISKDLPFAHARFCTTEGIATPLAEPVVARIARYDDLTGRRVRSEVDGRQREVPVHLVIGRKRPRLYQCGGDTFHHSFEGC